MAGTGIRNRWRRGSYLIVDDESGHTHYSEDIVERYDGILFRRDGNEDEIRQHPQLYVRALDDPRALSDVRPQVAATAPNFVDANIVQGIRKPSGAADHLSAELEPWSSSARTCHPSWATAIISS